MLVLSFLNDEGLIIKDKNDELAYIHFLYEFDSANDKLKHSFILFKGPPSGIAKSEFIILNSCERFPVFEFKLGEYKIILRLTLRKGSFKVAIECDNSLKIFRSNCYFKNASELSIKDRVNKLFAGVDISIPPELLE